MKIILYAYQHSKAITGTDRMARNFIAELQKIDKVNEYIVVCSSEVYIQEVITGENFRIIKPVLNLRQGFAKRLLNKVWRTILPLRLRIANADVFFSFHNMSLPDIKVAKRMIASNLDLIPIVLDEYKKLSSKQIKIILKSAKRADSFMSISNFSKNELVDVLGIDPKKITVIPLAADDTFMASSQSRNPKKKYILTIGGSEPRKRVNDVIQAFSGLPEHIQHGCPLYVVGGDWHGKKLGSTNKNIRLLGYVADTELPNLYRQASAFVFASEYEGFGFAILEAMKANTPVITSNATSLNEVAGGAALEFEPGDINTIKKQINQLIDSSDLQEELRKKGRERSSQFSWSKSAKKLHELLINDVIV